MKRLFLVISSAFICGMLSTSCSTQSSFDNYEKLEGTSWIAKTDSAVFTLRFVDKSVCLFGGVRNYFSYSANQIAYNWRYRSDVDSMTSLFHIFETDEEGGKSFYSHGSIENGKLYLIIPKEDVKVLWFHRQKE